MAKRLLLLLLVACSSTLFSYELQNLIDAAYAGNQIELNIIIKKRPEWRNAALVLSSQFGHLSIVKDLVETGADLSAINDETKNTSLHAAITEDHPEVALFLIKKGAPLNAKNLAGNAPIHLAVKKEQIEVIKALINRGADLAITNNAKETPFDMVKNKPEMLKALTKLSTPSVLTRLWSTRPHLVLAAGATVALNVALAAYAIRRYGANLLPSGLKPKFKLS